MYTFTRSATPTLLTVVFLLRRDSRAMMQLGEIAMEAAMKSSATAQLAEKWYRRSAAGDQPQPDALFQLARMHHEVHILNMA